MAYGTVKVDNVTFTYNTVDTSTTFSGLHASTTNNLTLSGTASANTFTGTTANFTNANAQNISVTTLLSGLAITGGTAGFTTVTGTTVTGTTANFVTVSGTSITGGTAGFTTVTGTTVTGTTANFVTLSGTTVTGNIGQFTSLTGATTTMTSGVFALGTEPLPSISFVSDPNTGIYSPGADQLAVATNGTGKVLVDTNGTILVNTTIQATSNGGLNIENTGAGTFTNPLALLNRGTTNNTGVSLSFRGLSAASAETDYAYLRMLATDTTSRHGRIEFWTANSGTVTEKLCITRDGLVGIGAPVPGRRLVVAGDTNTVCAVQGSNIGTSSVFLGDTDDESIGAFTYNHSSNHLEVKVNGAERARIRSDGMFEVKGAGTSGSSPAFSVNGSTPADSFVIDSSGRLGIGNSSPRGIIHVGADLHNGATDAAAINLKQTSTTAATGIYLERSAERKGYYIYLGGSEDSLNFQRNSSGTKSDVMSLTRDGLVGIGSTSPNQLLQINSTSVDARIQLTNSVTGSTNSDGFHLQCNNSDIYFDNKESGNFIFQSGANEAARIDSSRRLLVGTSSTSGENCTLQVRNNSALAAEFFTSSDDTAGPYIHLTKSRGTAASPTEVSSGDTLGAIAFFGYDGSTYRTAARIVAEADGTWTDGGDTTDNPGRLVFSTTADGASTPTEWLRITSTGQVRLAGAGITFNGDTAAANQLDDYEEGTWTSAIACGTSGTITVATTHNTQSYTKIGRQVTVTANLYISAVSSPVGTVTITGLPFTSGSGNGLRSAAAINADNLTSLAITSVIGRIMDNSSGLVISTYNTGTENAAASYFQAGSTLYVSLTYFV